jgi:cytochrome c oxidase cbb3-type subunit 3
MKHRTLVLQLAVLILVISPLPGQQGGRGGPPAQSPASRLPPKTATPQTYPADQIQAGESRFISQCGFCHGRDAQGGESGPDLTRSLLVAGDVRGDKLTPLILAGRPAAGMPAFSLPSADIDAIVAFIHDAKTKTESEKGNRRSVDVEDLQTGNAEAGKQYFNGAGGCAKCHSESGSFATVGARFQGLALMQRMLYPRNRGPRAATPDLLPATVVTSANGQTISGRLTYRDEFTITIVDANEWSHSFPVATVKIEGDDPLREHTEQLGKYTEKDMHDVFAYLQSLK